MPESTTPRSRRTTGLKTGGMKKTPAPTIKKSIKPAAQSAAPIDNSNAWPFKDTLTVSDGARKRTAHVEAAAPSEAERAGAKRIDAARRQAGPSAVDNASCAVCTPEEAQAAATAADGRKHPVPIDLDNPDLARMISEAAYYHAERRNFRPGYELEDWVAGECEVNARLLQLRRAAGKNLIG